MTTLMIKDLAVTEVLDGKAMSGVRGGSKGYPGYWTPSFQLSASDFSFDATQMLAQTQNTTVNNGNNVAFSHGITANVNPHQDGHNNITFA